MRVYVCVSLCEREFAHSHDSVKFYATLVVSYAIDIPCGSINDIHDEKRTCGRISYQNDYEYSVRLSWVLQFLRFFKTYYLPFVWEISQPYYFPDQKAEERNHVFLVRIKCKQHRTELELTNSIRNYIQNYVTYGWLVFFKYSIKFQSASNSLFKNCILSIVEFLHVIFEQM